MPTVAPATRSGIYGIRDKDCLRLWVEVPYAQSVALRLLCSEHPWSFQADLGLCHPGQGPLDLRVEDWPKDSTYLLARFYDERGKPEGTASQWLAGPPV